MNQDNDDSNGDGSNELNGSSDISPKNKKIWNSFDDHITDAWEEMYMLGELERIYPFFRIHTPQVGYDISKNMFQMIISYGLKLHAKNKDKYFFVDFRRPHNSLVVTHQNGDKTYHIEAQEEIMCDPDIGYENIYKFFANHGQISRNDTDFHIVLNDDMLHFDDHNMKHMVFRGWTGGYDPSYTGSKDPFNEFSMILKEKWDAKPYLESLELRISTLKMLFEGINQYALFDVEAFDQPINKIPDFKEKYKTALNSDYYKFMQDFGKRLGEKFQIHPKYAQSIVLSGEETPHLEFHDKNSGISFFIDSAGNYKDTKVTCELHIPKHMLERQDFDRSYLHYTEPIIYNGKPLQGAEKTMVGVYDYISSEKDIPASLEKCLNKLM